MLEAAFWYFADGRQFAIAELVRPVVDVALSVDSNSQADVVDSARCRSCAVTPVTVRNAFSCHAVRECCQLIRRSRVPEPLLPIGIVHAGRPELDDAVITCSHRHIRQLHAEYLKQPGCHRLNISVAITRLVIVRY